MNRNALGLWLAVGAALAPAARAQEPLVLGRSFALRSRVLGEDRKLMVATPAGYGQGRERYPVLYLTDGETQFAHTAASAAFLARNNRIPPLIVVGIMNTDRTRDLTPTNAPLEAGGQQTRFPTAGGADNFLKFIETELFPHVEKTYRTRPFRILCGHSLGGLFALHALFSRPELFNAVVAASPTLIWDDDLPLRRAKEFFAAHSELKRTLFVTAGSEGPEMEQAFGELESILKRVTAGGFLWGAERLPDEDHGSVVLRSYYAGLRKVYEPWLPPIDRSTGVLEGGLETLKRHYADVSARFGYEVPAPEAIVNAVGYAELVRGRTDRALLAFRYNVQTYPDSPNVHDSLGEGLQAAGERGQARDSYARAVAVGEKARDPNLPTFRQHLAAAEAALAAPRR